MNMADMAKRTAQLWLEFAEAENGHPQHELPPDPYNQAFYRLTREDPDNEVSCMGAGRELHSTYVMQCWDVWISCSACYDKLMRVDLCVGGQKVASLIGQESLETLLQLATRNPQILSTSLR